MNMAVGQDRRSGDGASSQDATDQASKIKPASPLTANQEVTKHWAKYYRTSIASGMSIMLSQSVSVRFMVSSLVALMLTPICIVSFGQRQDPHASVRVSLILLSQRQL